LHSQDTEVRSWEERTQCNAVSRSYLHAEICNYYVLVISYGELL
jgi:hypothetical protein